MYGTGYGCGCDPCYPGYGYPVAGAYAGPVGGVGCFGGGFALIVVLFILLIIIGASCWGAW
jgi:uncharacterized protein (TIGR01732 family)